MFKVVSVDRMREIEAAADDSGISYAQLMENAGRAAANRALQVIENISEPKVTVLVGPGNNGGDGMVAGLLIAQDNPEADVRFYLLKPRPDDDPHFSVIQEAELFNVVADDDHDKRVLRNMVASSDLVIDALFGIGATPPMRDEAAKILRSVNQAINERRRAQPDDILIDPTKAKQVPHAPRLYVLAIDGPSGLNFDTGEIDKSAIEADESITFIAAKTGQFAFPGAASIGTLTVANAGVPLDFKALKDEKAFVIDSSYAAQHLPDRPQDSNKGTFGKTLVVAGSVNYVGAPALVAESAYRSGAGLVTIGTPRPVVATLASAMREPTWLLLPHDMGVLNEGAVSVLLEEIPKYKAMIIGPGISTDKATAEFLSGLLEQTGETVAVPQKRKIGFQVSADADQEEKKSDEEKVTLPPLVIDADGLNLLSKMDNWWEKLPENTIITPHPGEMGRLADLEISDVLAQRWQLVQEKAAEWNVIIVLKGAHTLIANPQGDVAVSPFKTDALATAGTGDVLAGIIVGLLSQGMEPFAAAAVGCYVHGLAGTYASEGRSNRSVIAGDVITALSQALQDIELS